MLRILVATDNHLVRGVRMSQVDPTRLRASRRRAAATRTSS
jgi:hypothetical protein